MSQLWDPDDEALRHYNLEIRFYKGVGHWAWFEDWIMCPMHYDTFWTNKVPPNKSILSLIMNNLAQDAEDAYEVEAARAEAKAQREEEMAAEAEKEAEEAANASAANASAAEAAEEEKVSELRARA